MHVERNQNWATVLRSKYTNPKRLCSHTWSTIKKGQDMFNKGLKWIVGGNSNLKFWNDKWLSEGPLRNMIIGPLNRDENQLQVKDMILDGMWDLHRISFDLPSIVGRTIGAIPIPMSPSTLDCISWAYSPSGNFDGKSAYRIAKGG